MLSSSRQSVAASILFVICFLFSVPVFAETSDYDKHSPLISITDEHIVSLGEKDENVYLIGNIISVDSPMSGDIYALAKSLRIAEHLIGDIGFIGEDIILDERVHGDARIIADSGVVRDEITGEVLFVGTSFVLEQDGIVGSDIALYADAATVHGTVHGDMRVSGLNLVIHGTVDGTVYAEDTKQITLHEGANVTGDIVYTDQDKTETLTLHPGAIVGGDTMPVKEEGKKALFVFITTLISLAVGGFLAYGALRSRWNTFLRMSVTHALLAVLIGLAFVILAALFSLVLLFIPGFFGIAMALLLSLLLVIFLGIIVTPVLVGAVVWLLFRKKDIHVTAKSTALGVGLLLLASLFTPLLLVITVVSTLFFIGVLTRSIIVFLFRRY